MSEANALGKERIGKLLWNQSFPAALGFMVMSLNTIADTLFVGQFVGALAVGAEPFCR